MAGAASDSQLNRSGRTRCAVATLADDVAIRRLLRDNPMRGAISVGFEREPDYFRGVNLAGGSDQTIVVHTGETLACMGRCTTRTCWVNGRETRAGYLAELRLDNAQRGRSDLLRRGYRFFHDLQRDDPAEIYYTAIVEDNERARRLLERGVRGLPAYSHLADLDTVLVAVPKGGQKHRLTIEPATADHVPAMLQLLNDSARRHQLAASWSREGLLAVASHGLPLHRFYTVSEGDRMLCCGALWDQRQWRQTVVRGYSMPLALTRPVLNMAGRVFGWPRLPDPGSILSHALLAPLAFAEGAEALLPDFVASLFGPAHEAGLEFLTLGLPAADDRLRLLRRRFSTRTWRSRLYRVDWPDLPTVEVRGTILPDVAFL